MMVDAILRVDFTAVSFGRCYGNSLPAGLLSCDCTMGHFRFIRHTPINAPEPCEPEVHSRLRGTHSP